MRNTYQKTERLATVDAEINWEEIGRALCVQVGRRIRDIRLEKKLSLVQVHEKGGPTASTLSLIENGLELKCNVLTLRAVARALQVPACTLFVVPEMVDYVENRGAHDGDGDEAWTSEDINAFGDVLMMLFSMSEEEYARVCHLFPQEKRKNEMGKTSIAYGVVLPHGGIVENIFRPLRGMWAPIEKSFPLRLSDDVTLLNADFVKPGAALGRFCQEALVMPLVLLQAEWGLEWSIRTDGVRPHGTPQYYMTQQTGEALTRASVLGDGVLEIDGERYRLHAACFDDVHVALLMRVDA